MVAGRNNLEQRLNTKKRELQEVQEKCQHLQQLQGSASKKLEDVSGSLKIKSESLKNALAEKAALESQLAISASETAVSFNPIGLLCIFSRKIDKNQHSVCQAQRPTLHILKQKVKRNS